MKGKGKRVVSGQWSVIRIEHAHFSFFLFPFSFFLLHAIQQTAIAYPIPITAGMKIAGQASIRPGVYHLSDPGAGIVQVSGRNFTIDFHGARIVGPGTATGIGIHITDARQVTIKNADVSGCLWGIVVERSRDVRLLDCITSRNADLPPGTVIDESGRQPEDNHGGGILIRECLSGSVLRCRSQHQWDGIDVVRSEGVVIEEGDYSYNGNWGLHLWNSSRNTFRRNRAIWCTTGEGRLFQALTGWQTYDSQAVGIDHNSNENLIEANDLRFGGDGIYIRANEGPITPGTVVPPRNGSHRNILRDNDCSFSPNNAIEVDLVDDTIIEGNNCSFSNYGMWLGYSRRCKVRGNLCINESTNAVEIENGQGDLFENNIFGYDTPRPDGQLVYLRQNGRDQTPSGPYRFENNLFYGAATGVLLKATRATLAGNMLMWPDPAKAQVVRGDAASAIIQDRYTIQAPRLVAEPTVTPDQAVIHPGELVTLRKEITNGEAILPLVEIDGIPVWVRRATAQTVSFQMPSDFWDRPAQKTAQLRIRTSSGWTPPTEVRIAWPGDRPRIDSISPATARVGESITITGANLAEGRLLLNGKPVMLQAQTPTKLVFRLPEGISTSGRCNVLFERGAGANTVSTWPIVY